MKFLYIDIIHIRTRNAKLYIEKVINNNNYNDVDQHDNILYNNY